MPTFDDCPSRADRIRLRQVEMPNVRVMPTVRDCPSSSCATFELPKFDLPKVDLPSVDVRSHRRLARDAAYVGVGLVVMTVERVAERCGSGLKAEATTPHAASWPTPSPDPRARITPGSQGAPGTSRGPGRPPLPIL